MVSEKFELDKKTKAIISEGLAIIEKLTDSSFEEKARMLTAFLEKKGLTIERDTTFGDVLLTTSEGWGVVVLFNEKARNQNGDVVWKLQ